MIDLGREISPVAVETMREIIGSVSSRTIAKSVTRMADWIEQYVEENERQARQLAWYEERHRAVQAQLRIWEDSIRYALNIASNPPAIGGDSEHRLATVLYDIYTTRNNLR